MAMYCTVYNGTTTASDRYPSCPFTTGPAGCKHPGHPGSQATLPQPPTPPQRLQLPSDHLQNACKCRLLHGPLLPILIFLRFLWPINLAFAFPLLFLEHPMDYLVWGIEWILSLHRATATHPANQHYLVIYIQFRSRPRLGAIYTLQAPAPDTFLVRLRSCMPCAWRQIGLRLCPLEP